MRRQRSYNSRKLTLAQQKKFKAARGLETTANLYILGVSKQLDAYELDSDSLSICVTFLQKAYALKLESEAIRDSVFKPKTIKKRKK